MRTNYSGFALAVSMGLIVILLGFLALSAGGLVRLGPEGEVAAGMPADSLKEELALPDYYVEARSYVPATPQEAAAIEAGDALFKTNCAQCHAVNEKVVGPALAGISKRRSAAWVVAWVHNPAKVIASGDDYAVKLFEANGKQQMPSFPQLTDKDIRAILEWIKAQQGYSVAVDYAPAPAPAVAAR